jgi:hypothetical protein
VGLGEDPEGVETLAAVAIVTSSSIAAGIAGESQRSLRAHTARRVLLLLLDPGHRTWLCVTL